MSYGRGGYGRGRGGGGYNRRRPMDNEWMDRPSEMEGGYHTGDPARDLEYEREGGPTGGGSRSNENMSRPEVPDEVADYLKYFKRCVCEQKVAEIHNLYEYGFPELTERYYREKFWPTDEIVAKVVGEEPRIFLVLYKELYYRYVYTKMQRGPSLGHRYDSYQNYQDLFFELINVKEPLELNLPNQWLWDIIDEFVYQFQSFCLYKANPAKRNQDDLEELAQIERDTTNITVRGGSPSIATKVWNLYPVLNILYSLIEKSQINFQLKAINAGEDPSDYADDCGRHPLYFKLGYFSLIGLLRTHTLLGDYHQALKVVENLELDPKGLYNTVPSCLVTLHYFVGFCHMMKRQYQEAIRIFVNCLLFIQRTRNLHQQQQQHKSWQYDGISKTNDQLYHLLAICMVLQPQRIDDSIHSQLIEKHSDRMSRMHRGELNEIEAAFQQGSPKFLAPTQTSYELGTGNTSKEPLLQQSRMFMEEMQQQQSIPILRGYLKLYTSMPLAKLASFMNINEEELLSQLLSFKHKLWDSAQITNPDEDTTADLDFYIEKDMIHIADTKVGRRVGEYFIKHIQKLMELNKNLARLKIGPKAK